MGAAQAAQSNPYTTALNNLEALANKLGLNPPSGSLAETIASGALGGFVGILADQAINSSGSAGCTS